MILYLTSDKNLGLFDFLENEKNTQIKKICGELSIETFTKYDIRKFAHAEFLIIDLSTIAEDIDVIIQNIISINSIYDMRIILFADELESEDLDRIIEETKNYNIITASIEEDIVEEALLCVSIPGMTKDYLFPKLYPDYSFNLGTDRPKFPTQLNIFIGGAMERVGTTTLAFNLTAYLNSIGAKVSYTEANENEHLKDIHNILFEKIIINNNYFMENNISYFFSFNIPSSEDFNFNIIDLGVINENTIDIFKNESGMKILCGGTRPYEINSLNKVITELEDIDNYNLIVSKNSMISLDKHLYSLGNFSMHKINYTNNLFDISTNEDTLKLLVDKLCIENSNCTIREN